MGAAMRDNQVAVRGKAVPAVMAAVAVLIVVLVAVWPERSSSGPGESSKDLFGVTTTTTKAGKGSPTTKPAPGTTLRAYKDKGIWFLAGDDVCNLLKVKEVRTAFRAEELSITKPVAGFNGQCRYAEDTGNPESFVLQVEVAAKVAGSNLQSWLAFNFPSGRLGGPFDCTGYREPKPEVSTTTEAGGKGTGATTTTAPPAPVERCRRLVRYANLGSSAIVIETPTQEGDWDVFRIAFESKAAWITLTSGVTGTGADGLDRTLQLARLLETRLPAALTEVKKPCKRPQC